MDVRRDRAPRWATLTIWFVVNAVCLLQAAGFLSRIPSGSMEVNHVLGYIIVALAAPAAAALIGLVRAHAEWRLSIGPAVFLVFVAFMVVVEYIAAVEFRSPQRLEILVPYLLLFFGSILLMGAPMLRLDRRLWFVTLATTSVLLISMVIAMQAGVG